MAVSGTAVGCLLAGALGAFADVGDAPDPGTWVTDGPVYAIADAGDRTIIGGAFSYVGPRTGAGVPLAPVGAANAGKLSPGLGSFPAVSGGRVRAAVGSADGSWYIGGDFTSVGGTARSGLARLVLSAGEFVVDPDFAPRPDFTPGDDGGVHALALGAVTGKDDHVLYVGGKFDSVNGDFAQQNLAALHRGDGHPVALLTSPDNTVRSIDVLRQDDTGTAFPVVFIAGTFANVGAEAKNGLAAMWGVGAEATAGTVITELPASSAAAPQLRTVHVGQAKWKSDADHSQIGVPVYAGGDFGLEGFKFTLTVPDGAPAGSTYGTNPAMACTDCGVSVRSLTTSADGTTLYIGGRFDAVHTNTPRRNLAAIRGFPDVFPFIPPDLSVRTWDPSPNAMVHALARDAGGDLYAGGDFTELRDATDGVFRSREGLAAVAPASAASATDDAALRGWDPRATGGLGGRDAGVVTAVAASASGVYAGGSFTSIGASPHKNVAALSTGGSVIDDWTPSTDGPVYTLAVGNERVYLGGDFTHAGGEERGRLAAVGASGSGAIDSAFNPAAGPVCVGPDCSAVLSLALIDQTLYVGGTFTSLAGVSSTNAGAVDAITGAWRNWPANPDGTVYSLLATCGTVYAGGSFSTAGGQARSRIAALDPGSGSATEWNPSVEGGAVYALARDLDVVYAGGSFAKIGGTARNRLAALDAATGSATSWNPGVPGVGDVVRALAVPPGGSVIYAGGRFTGAGRADRSNVAALSRTDGDATAWNPQVDATVRALASDGASVLLGGEFRQIDSVMQHGFGSFGLGSGTAEDQTLHCAAPAVPPPVEEPPVEEPPVEEPPAPRPSGPTRDTIAPQVGALGLTNPRFRTARPSGRRARSAARKRAPVGTRIRYTLSEVAVVRFAFKRKTRVRCSSAKRRRPCYRWRGAGAVRNLSHAGAMNVLFKGRVGTRWLSPGRYRVRLRAVDLAGNRSRSERLVFTVVRG